MNARLILFLVFIIINVFEFMWNPLIGLASFPSTLLSCWVWRDSVDLETLDRRIYGLEKKDRENS